MDKQSSAFYRRYIAISFIILSVCFISFIGIKFYKHYNYANSEHPNQAQATQAATFLSNAMQLPLWNLSSTLAEPAVDAIQMTLPDNASILVTTVNQIVFIDTTKPQFSAKAHKAVTRDVTYDGDYLGEVTVFYKPVNAFLYAWNKVSFDMLYFIIQLTALAVFSWLFLSFKRKEKDTVAKPTLSHS